MLLDILTVLVIAVIALYYLQLYIYSWVVFFAFNYGIVELFPRWFHKVHHLDLFLGMLFCYLIIKLTRSALKGEAESFSIVD